MKRRLLALGVMLALIIGLLPWFPAQAEAQEPDHQGYIVKLRDDAALPFSADGLGRTWVWDSTWWTPWTRPGAWAGRWSS